MSFCASCGRQRNGTQPFCGGCGARFSDPPAETDDRGPAADAAPDDLPAGVTRTDVDAGVTRVEPPTAAPDPFASWYQQEPQGVRSDADSGPSGPPFQPGPAPGGPLPAGPPPAGPPARGGRRGLFMVLAVVVVLAAGGGAYALASTLGKHSTAQSTAGATTPAASSPAAASPTGGAVQQASSPATSTSAGPTPSPTLSLVAISPGMTPSAAQPQVETLLSHYFHGINTHDYAEYAGTLNAAEQAKQTQSEFSSGYSSTADSGMTLTGLSDSGNGGLTATVTFTSRQSPAQSVDKSACNAWTLNLYLVPQGGGYLIGPAPSSYQPTYSDC